MEIATVGLLITISWYRSCAFVQIFFFLFLFVYFSVSNYRCFYTAVYTGYSIDHESTSTIYCVIVGMIIVRRYRYRFSLQLIVFTAKYSTK